MRPSASYLLVELVIEVFQRSGRMEILAGLLPDNAPCKVHFEDGRVLVEVDEYGVDPDKLMLGQATPERVAIRLQNGKTATLLDIVPVSRSGNLGISSFVQTRMASYRTLVGPSEFLDEQLIESIEFSPSNELLAIYYRQHRRHVELARDQEFTAGDLLSAEGVWAPIIVDAIDRDRLVVFSRQLSDLEITIAVAISTNHTPQGANTTERRFVRLAYGNPQPLRIGLQDIGTICDFFSLVVGEVVAPHAIKVVSGETHELFGPPTFDVHVTYRPPGKDLDPKFPFRCLISPQLDAVGYENSIAIWLDRRNEWLQSYRLGTESIGRQHEVTRHRFLDAIGWFESISDFYLPPADQIPKATVGKAARAAAKVFLAGGHEIDESRLRGLLSPINVLSLSMRLRAAISHIRQRFGTDALPPDSEELAGIIASIRGAFAHGENAFEGALGGRIYEASLTVENICKFLTLSAMPLDLHRISSAHHNPIIDARQQLFEFYKERAAQAVTSDQADQSAGT